MVDLYDLGMFKIVIMVLYYLAEENVQLHSTVKSNCCMTTLRRM